MNVGIIGLGFMGATHLKAYLSHPAVQVRAVCTRDARKRAGDLTQVGGNLGTSGGEYDFSKIRCHEDWRDLIDDPTIDAVDICLPTEFHEQVAVAALHAAKDVLVEKPMALTVDSCQRMIGATEEHDRILMVAHVLRFWPEYECLRAFAHAHRTKISDAYFGRRCGVPSWSSWLPTAASGGAILDLLVHDIDQIIALFGMPQQVEARTDGGVDTVEAHLRYPDGPPVRLQGGWYEPDLPFSMEFEVNTRDAKLRLDPHGVLTDTAGSDGCLMTEMVGSDAYAAEIGYFVECCRTRERPSRCPPEQSLQAVELARAIIDRRQTGEGRTSETVAGS